MTFMAALGAVFTEDVCVVHKCCCSIVSDAVLADVVCVGLKF